MRTSWKSTQTASSQREHCIAKGVTLCVVAASPRPRDGDERLQYRPCASTLLCASAANLGNTILVQGRSSSSKGGDASPGSLSNALVVFK